MRAEDLTVGTRVDTPGGPGGVFYVRLTADLQTVAAVSVVLDARRGAPGYEGTIYPAHAVIRLETPETRTVAYACDGVHTGPAPADPLEAWGVCPACRGARP